MEVVILSDNKVTKLRPQGLKAEWGFSALIKGRENVLFDTGQTGIAFDNLITLREERPAKVVLSHGHYDHTGGLMEFVKAFDLKVFAHPDAFLPRFYRGEYIGIPFRKERIRAEIVEHREPLEVSKGIWALGEIPRRHKSALLSDSYIIREGRKEFDEILDDQSVAVKTDNGIALILGCCHSGLMNTVEYAEEVLGDEVKYVIGGTHLISLRGEELLDVVRWLDSKVDLIAPCHCTGLENEFLLKSKLGEKCKIVGVGSVVKFFNKP